MFKKLLLVIILFCSISSAYGQQMFNAGAQVLVYGTVVDESTGAPVELKMEFRSPNDQKFVVNTDDKGKFKQLLFSNATYEIIFKRYDVLRETIEFTVDTAAQYKEDTVQIACRVLRPGLKLYKFDMFDAGNNLNQTGMDNIKKLKMTMRMNRSLHFNLIINGDSQAIIEQRKAILDKELDSFGSFKEKLRLIDGTNADKDLVIEVNKIEEAFK